MQYKNPGEVVMPRLLNIAVTGVWVLIKVDYGEGNGVKSAKNGSTYLVYVLVFSCDLVCS